MPDASILVTAPKFTPKLVINRFLNEHDSWIREKQATILASLHSLTKDREKLFFRGKEYDFRLTVSATQQSSLKFVDSSVIVISPSEEHSLVRQVIESDYRKLAAKYFKERVPLLADLVNRDVKTVTIRSQRSRWGSCSNRNTISLNWRLIMAPDFVSDYVIYHELAHLTHMNHSRNFWNLVAGYHPRYKDAEKWLKDHHQLLQF